MIASIAAMTLLTLTALALVILPLLRRPRPTAPRPAFDRAVYRDQLRELDRELAQGLITADAARAATIEIQRRMLATDTPEQAPDRTSRSPRLAVGVCVTVAICAGLVYTRLGAPGAPDLPFASRSLPAAGTAVAGTNPADAAAHADMAAAAAKLRQRLAATPNDGQGWLLYARTASMLNNWNEATDAYRRAIDLGQTGADVFSAYGEMLVMAQDGIVAPAAHAAFDKALAIEPGQDVARFYLALAHSQAGEVEPAIRDWLALAADLPSDSPMRGEIARRIAEAARSGGIAAPPLPEGRPATAAPGPDAAQIDAAADMPAAQRDQMVNAMVTQLATRLKSQPDDRDGWLRLGRAYTVQGKADLAADAFDHALRLKPDDTGTKLQLVAVLLAPLKPTDPLPVRAVSLLHEAAKEAPDAPEVLWYLGVEAAREGRRSEARANWTRLLAGLDKSGEDYGLVKGALTELGSN